MTMIQIGIMLDTSDSVVNKRHSPWPQRAGAWEDSPKPAVMSAKECPEQSQVQKSCYLRNKSVEGTKSV